MPAARDGWDGLLLKVAPEREAILAALEVKIENHRVEGVHREEGACLRHRLGHDGVKEVGVTKDRAEVVIEDDRDLIGCEANLLDGSADEKNPVEVWV